MQGDYDGQGGMANGNFPGMNHIRKIFQFLLAFPGLLAANAPATGLDGAWKIELGRPGGVTLIRKGQTWTAR